MSFAYSFNPFTQCTKRGNYELTTNRTPLRDMEFPHEESGLPETNTGIFQPYRQRLDPTFTLPVVAHQKRHINRNDIQYQTSQHMPDTYITDVSSLHAPDHRDLCFERIKPMPRTDFGVPSNNEYYTNFYAVNDDGTSKVHGNSERQDPAELRARLIATYEKGLVEADALRKVGKDAEADMVIKQSERLVLENDPQLYETFVRKTPQLTIDKLHNISNHSRDMYQSSLVNSQKLDDIKNAIDNENTSRNITITAEGQPEEKESETLRTLREMNENLRAQLEEITFDRRNVEKMKLEDAFLDRRRAEQMTELQRMREVKKVAPITKLINFRDDLVNGRVSISDTLASRQMAGLFAELENAKIAEETREIVQDINDLIDKMERENSIVDLVKIEKERQEGLKIEKEKEEQRMTELERELRDVATKLLRGEELSTEREIDLSESYKNTLRLMINEMGGSLEEKVEEKGEEKDEIGISIQAADFANLANFSSTNLSIVVQDIIKKGISVEPDEANRILDQFEENRNINKNKNILTLILQSISLGSTPSIADINALSTFKAIELTRITNVMRSLNQFRISFVEFSPDAVSVLGTNEPETSLFVIADLLNSGLSSSEVVDIINADPSVLKKKK